MLRVTVIASIAVLTSASDASSRTILYVDQNANGPIYDGWTWCTAFIMHEETRVFLVAPTGEIAEIDDPSAEAIDPGKSYWVRALRDAEYDGPVAIDSATLRGVEFVEKQTRSSITIDNLSRDSKQVSLSYLASEEAAVGEPVVAVDAGEGDWLRWLDRVGGDVCLAEPG